MIIAIEGIDGSGKGTQAARLVERLRAAGRGATLLSFPRYGQTFHARAVADYLNGAFGALDAMPAQFPAMLFAGDRRESLGLIREALDRGDVLVIDRYVASNQAHQASKLDASARPQFLDWVAELEYAVNGLPPADLTLWFDLPVDRAMAMVLRKAARDYTDAAADLHEGDRDYLARCREVYAYLHAHDARSRWQRIDLLDADGAHAPVEAVGERVWAAVDAG